MQRAVSYSTSGTPTDMNAVDQLIKAGMTALGARQVLNGEVVSGASDRNIIGILVAQATASGKGSGHVDYEWMTEDGYG